MFEQLATDPFISVIGPHIGMPDQCHVTLKLDSHYSNDFVFLCVTPKLNSIINLSFQLFFCHIWFMPSVGRNNAFVCYRCIIDNVINFFEVLLFTFYDHSFRALCCLITTFIVGRQYTVFLQMVSRHVVAQKVFLYQLLYHWLTLASCYKSLISLVQYHWATFLFPLLMFHHLTKNTHHDHHFHTTQSQLFSCL